MNCKYSKECGACNGCTGSYAESLKKKEQWIKQLIGKYGKVNPIIGMDSPYHYRNKVHAVLGTDRSRNIISGIYKEGTHKLVPIDDCLIEDEAARAVIKKVEKIIKSFKIEPYDEDRHRGLMRHILVRVAKSTGEMMLILVTASNLFPSRNNVVKEIRKQCPEVTTIIHNVNDKDTTMVLGKQERVVYGPGFITDYICGCQFKISAQSFYQVNPTQTEVMYKLAIDNSGLTKLPKGSLVLDAYCGIGTIGIVAAKSNPNINLIGVELNPEAVKDARKNAQANYLKNIRFECFDAGKFMVRMAQAGEKLSLVFMDPPRSGSSKEFIDAIAKLKPERIAYISCGPESLARDLEMLVKKGYKMEQAWPVDNFCWTEHVETVCLLSKK